jgi:hypothetical protein
MVVAVSRVEWIAARVDDYAALNSTGTDDRPPPKTVLEWAERYREIDGRPFSLDRFAPLAAIYDDDHPHICVIKPAQRGISEWAINYASFALDRGADVWTHGEKAGLNVGYIFPTKTDLIDFSKERVSGLVEETDYLRALYEDGEAFNAATFKQVGSSYLYLRGGWNARALKTFPADVIILDEYDEMDPKAPALARRRMNASLVRRELDISTPTIPGVGIHALYLQSDRRVYEQQHACGEWVSYDFFRDVRVDGRPYDEWVRRPAELIRASEVRLHCPSCSEPLTDDERCAVGRWRAEQPEVTGLRGYQIPWWPFPVVDLMTYAVTAISANPSDLTELYRSDLGQPYDAAGSRITEMMLGQLSHDLPGGVLPVTSWAETTMGVDPGARFHYRVSADDHHGRRCVLAMGSVGSWSDLDGLMDRWRVRLCVVDAMPELHAAQEFAARHQGRVLRAFYPQASAMSGQLFVVNEDKGVVQVNRTMAMDRVYANVAKGAEHWPAEIHNDREVIAHMKAPVRVLALDARGQEQATWVHTQPDHLYHASVYDTVAREALPAEAGVWFPS